MVVVGDDGARKKMAAARTTGEPRAAANGTSMAATRRANDGAVQIPKRNCSWGLRVV